MQDQPSDEGQRHGVDTNLFLRGDTMLGACEGIGRDFGFNPNWLRMLFAGAFYWNPAAVIGAYVALALLVAASRMLFPESRSESSAALVEPCQAESGGNLRDHQESLQLAA